MAPKAKKASAASSKDSNKIIATSQTSRFHVDTLTTLSKEIDLKNVNISIGDQLDILVDTDLRLKENVHYGLVGRNGQGKSIILKAIAEKLIPGMPENLNSMLADQVQDDQSGGKGRTKTVIQVVLESDKKRTTAMDEYHLLTSALESDNPSAILNTIELDRAFENLFVAQKTADRRSGARGAEARKQLLAAEARVKEAQSAVSTKHNDAVPRVQALLEEVKGTLDTMDAEATESVARRILLGLGFSQEQLDGPYQALSGGWRSRCSLASVLVQNPDILILDEPTNYLDIPAILWLQSYIQALESTTVLIVAHDRDFLDEVTEETIILRKQTLTYYEGAISAAERAIMKKRTGMIRMKEGLDRKKVQVEKTIAKAKNSLDDKKVKMAASRQRKLDERWGAEVNAKGHRFKLNRDFGGYHLTGRDDVEIDDLDAPIKFPVVEPEDLRFPGALFNFSNVSFSYSRTGPVVLDSINLTMHPGDRIGLMGKNGQGKSTIVKLVMGQFKPMKGTIERHPRTKMGYYSQHSVEELTTEQVGATSALAHFMESLKPDISIDEPTARSFLGSLGLHGSTAIMPIKHLSGGQKVRLALALIFYPAPHLLVLDEVSTHLDSDSLVALIRCLRAYSGGILLVSHDRHLLRCLVEGAPIIRPTEDDSDEEEEEAEEEDSGRTRAIYRVGPKGKVKLLPGGVDEYVKIVEKRLKKNG